MSTHTNSALCGSLSIVQYKVVCGHGSLRSTLSGTLARAGAAGS